MGVRFYDNENMSTSSSTHTSCNCNTCNQQTPPSAAATTQTTSNLNHSNNFSSQKSGILREIVGNCKEMKIEDNCHNLRIVGNNNRIRVNVNVGDITIIGNNTRLKIKVNHGHVKYTGNNGRISLGKDSTEQLVDYSGCNGILKVKNSKKCGQENDDVETKNNIAMGSTNVNDKLNYSKRKEKYSSYSSLPCESKVFQCHTDYNNMFNRKKSMPNITTNPIDCGNTSRNCAQQLQKNIVPKFGNIVIENSSNICITSCSYTH